ncbi:MAG: YqjK-like family protein [Rhodoferax sp.]|uniref:YqjK-like family protein n=1 Tax=Rhodoferax sp. TaxID=50421 RepID=UPI0026373D59|nr:YqjK-like family protein [Rhodoferax sp.]MDD5334462.1 YqjK-like family protein [Rhodoferax sp.]
MNRDELILRQQQLLVRSAELRLGLADQAQVFKRPLAVVDTANQGLRWLYGNPQWSLAALAILVVLRPRRTLVWGRRLWSAWRMLKRAQDWVAAGSLRD